MRKSEAAPDACRAGTGRGREALTARPQALYTCSARALKRRACYGWREMPVVAVGSAEESSSPTSAITDLAKLDFFSDGSLMSDAFGYYEAIRAKGPVWQEPRHGAFMVTGYEEISEIFRHPATFSSCNAFGGPFPGLPGEAHDPDDVGDLDR